MTEKLINSKPNGVFALILIELTIVLGIFIFIMGVGSENIFGIIIGPLLIVIAGLAHAGLKVVKPQEALVLTLFGKLYRYHQRTWFLLCQSLQRSSQPCKPHSTWTKW